MVHKKITVQGLRELIRKGEASDPLVFLESVMNGQDPRRHSRAYELMQDILQFSEDGLPTPEDWNELCDVIEADYRYHVVSINESTSAARTLTEYLHPKLKSLQIEESGLNKSSAAGDLTAEEIQLFKEKFNEGF